MGKTIMLRVDESLKETLEKIQRDVAVDLKKKYKLNRVTLHGTIASQIIAAQYRGQKILKFEIDKTSLNEGILRLL